MVFCAYCGKSFTRKEHLERHIPSHTNVKPHRCSACQLSFARRDLLQRHHSTYHEARDAMEPLPGGIPTVAGRTPIACLNCANAKTGCDKRVPCSRCAEKHLPCAARFARRSSKAAVRAAQATAAASAAAAAALSTQFVPLETQPGILLTPTFIDSEQQRQQQHAVLTVAEAGGMGVKTPLQSPLELEQISLGGAPGMDICLSDTSLGFEPPYLVQHHLHSPHQQVHQHSNMQPQYLAHVLGQLMKSPQRIHNQLSPGRYPSPHGVPNIGGIDEIVGFDNGNVSIEPEASYQDFLWANCPLDLDTYSTSLQHVWPGQTTEFAVAEMIHLAHASPESSDISSSSEAMNFFSSHESVHTRETSTISSIVSAEDRSCESGVNSSAGSQALLDLADGNMADGNMADGNMTGHSIFNPPQLKQQSSLFETASIAPCRNGGIPEFEAIVASEAAWPLIRCTPPIYSGSCPRTAIVHLECLEQKSKQEGTWTELEHFLDKYQPEAAEAPQVIRLTPRSRDKMLAITQNFLHKALDIHRVGIVKHQKTGVSSPLAADFNFLVLPPSRVIEYFLRNYVHSLAIYYSLIVRGVVDPNEMLNNNQASTLLVLLMIAQGAATVPMAEARYLSAGLLETCRISLFDQIEKNVELSADLTALRCALLFTLLGAWSGDKWHMDIAMGQRSMYLSMLKHAGMFEPQTSALNLSVLGSSELCWRSWLHLESQNRLVYNWVMVDQELSLFHDTAPGLSISDLRCPLPSSEALWLASTAEQWAALAERTYTLGSSDNKNSASNNLPAPAPSLCELFQDFLHDNLARRRSTLSPQQLRLLLHPLQSLLCHLQQMLSCLPEDSSMPHTSNRTVTKASTLQRLEEVQAQLHQWYELSMAYYKTSPSCAVTQCNLVLYHLISLNASTNFPEIERLARREGVAGLAGTMRYSPSINVTSLHNRCISRREEATFHCGQVLRLLNQMPFDHRPSWWSTALYRAVLIIWADSVCIASSSVDQQQPQSHQDPQLIVGTGSTISESPTRTAPVAHSPGCTSDSGCTRCNSGEAGEESGNTATLVAIDRVAPEDPSAVAYLWGDGSAKAVLTHSDGSHLMLDTPSEILTYGVKRIDEAVSTRISDGIRRKLISLAGNWGSEILD